MFDINNFEDDEVWDLICSGKTKGIFQLESNLGRHWAKQLKPRNINELAALISLIRPGCLKAFTDGKSMTQHYVDRKNGIDNVDYPDASLENILKETYGVIVYQEQSMKIAQELAGFSLKEADGLRKAIGKKKADLMEEIKQMFIDGAEKKGIVKKEIAAEIFSWIEKSNRYAFNKSHAVSYAINAYWSAYCKKYKPISFYVTYLNRSSSKPDSQRELKELIMDARQDNIEVYPPRLNHLYSDFTYNEGKIHFGMSHIKNVGTKECEAITEITKKENISEYTWMDCLIKIIHGMNLNKRSVVSLISVGAFNGKNNKLNRQKMLYEFDSWESLSEREKKCIADNYSPNQSLEKAIEKIPNIIKITPKRVVVLRDIISSLTKPFYDLTDDLGSIADLESKFLGCALTCGKTDSITISNKSCKDVNNGSIIGKVNLAVTISSIRKYKTKKGKNPGQDMAFLKVEDSSGELDSVTIFPEQYQEYKDLLIERNTVLLMSEISKKDKTSIIVNKVLQI